MGITFGDHLIDTGYYDITPEQEQEIEARDKEFRDRAYNCPCGGWDCSGLPGGPLYGCPYEPVTSGVSDLTKEGKSKA